MAKTPLKKSLGVFKHSDGVYRSKPSGTVLVWEANFDVPGALNSADWDYEVGAVRNGEDQYYQSGTSNAVVSGGELVITARQESVGGKSYTSASVITKGKREFLYGIIEIRAKIPSFVGSWSALWFLGANYDSVGWPLCGEIDLMEHVGYDPTNIHPGNIHTKYQDDNNLGGTPWFNTIGSFDPSVYHVYKMDWRADQIDFYIDGSLTHSFTNDGLGAAHWPFAEPLYLIMNLALGGSWGGLGGATNNAALPAEMRISYVRYYKRA